MKKSQQILIGLLGLVGLLLVLNFLGAFDGILGGDTSESDAARANLNQNNQQVAAVGQQAQAQVQQPGANGQVAPINADAQPPTATPAGPTTTMSFEETSFDFGTIDSGEKVAHLFKFKNTGEEPLVITNAKGSCGCTVPSWPKEPIAPGEGGEIKVEFDSKGKSGKQTKRVTIDANIPGGKTYLNISATVNKKDQGATSAPAQ